MEEAAARPFDAAVALMGEAAGSDPSTWSTISLAKFVRDTMLCPPSERSEPAATRLQLQRVLAALTDRGLDGHAFLRYGIGPQLSDKIAALASLRRLISLVAAHAEAPDFPEGLGQELPEEISAWSDLYAKGLPGPRSVLNGASPDGVLLDGIMEITHDWRARVNAWIQQAGTSELIDWQCPSESEFNEIAGDEDHQSSLGEVYTWIVDRSTETYLTDWARSSLYYEYRWLRGDLPNPFPESVTRLRVIRSVDLNSEIAERAVMSRHDDAQIETTAQLQIQATQMLKGGDRRSAVSIFRVILKMTPASASAKNNLGFSLIPDDPRKALRYLAAAARAGYDQPVINAHNRMLCHLQLESPKEALAVAEIAWSGSSVGQSIPAVLWARSREDWIFHHYPDARIEVARLALESARSTGDDSEEVWRGRLESLRSDSPQSDEGAE